MQRVPSSHAGGRTGQRQPNSPLRSAGSPDPSSTQSPPSSSRPSPSRSLTPGSSSRKKSASCSSNERRPFGTILAGRLSEPYPPEFGGSGASSTVGPGGEETGVGDRSACGRP